MCVCVCVCVVNSLLLITPDPLTVFVFPPFACSLGSFVCLVSFSFFFFFFFFFHPASPVGAYYATGFKPVRLLADPQFVRAWPGGMGDTKCGGNYAPTILPQMHAAKKDCQQVLWLFGEDELVTEVGTMNLFMHWKNDEGVEELITAPLDGTILAGVTRQSILDLGRQWGEFQVSEKYFTMSQLTRALKEGRVYEMFGSGTAATVSPVGEILYRDEPLSIPLELGSSGKLSKRFMDELFAIQYGEVEHEWAPVVC